MSQLGRITLLLCTFVAGGLCTAILFVIPDSYAIVAVVFYVLGQSISLAAFLLLDFYWLEVFSTDTRNFLSSTLDSITKALFRNINVNSLDIMFIVQIGAIVAPFIVDLGGQVDARLPPLVFGVMTMTAALVFFFLPETGKMTLAQNISDLESTGGKSLAVKLVDKVSSDKSQTAV